MTEDAKPSGIGGWLILPVIGLILLPINLLVMLVTIYSPIFTDGYWEVLTTPGSEIYHPMWAPVLIYEVVGNIVFLIGSLLLLVLLFRKHYLFPKLMIWFLSVNVVFIGIDLFLADLIPSVAAEPDPEGMKDFVRSIITAVIWIPYFILSKRVQNTFVRPVEKDVDPGEGVYQLG